MSQNAVEAAIGAAVLAVAAFFLFFAYSNSDVGGTPGGYGIEAAFLNAGGLSSGADVRVSGVRVGSVESIELDPNSYQAVVKMVIDSAVEIPLDTVALVTSDGLMGGSYVSMEIGGDIEVLEPGERMEFTQHTPPLTQLLGQAIFSMSGGDDGGSADNSSASDKPAAETSE